MIVLAGLLLVVIAGWLLRRRRKTELAGRDVERPVYLTERAGRRVSKRRYEHL